MKIVLVGQSKGQRKTRWGVAVLCCCIMGCFSAAVALGVYFALCRELPLHVAVIGFIGPFISIGIGIRRAWGMPLDQLQSLERLRA